MQNYPLISIVLPVYNGSKYVRQSIDSCLAQTYPNIELIVVDDCSTDPTPEIVKSYKDDRVRYIRNQTNLRLPASLNVGFRYAQGEYMTWTSHDNQYVPTAIEEMYAFLEQRPDVDFVYADVEVIDLETGQKTLKPCTHWTFYFENAIGACYLYTRRLYATVGEYDPRFELVEDYDYWLRIEKKFKIRRLPKVLYLYGDHPKSLTHLRLYCIDILAYILRYHHGYLTFDGLAEAMGIYMLKFMPFKKGSGGVWRQVLKRVSKLEFHLQFVFYSAMALSTFKKAGTLIKKARTKVFRKKQPFEAMVAGLSKPSHIKTQVLCIIPYLTMGGTERVMQDIVLGLTPQGFDFHLFCFEKDNDQWVKKFLTSFVHSIIIPAVYDAGIYGDYLAAVIEKLNIKIILLSNEHIAYKALAGIKQRFPGLKVIDIIHLEKVGGTHQHISMLGAAYLDKRVCISRHLLGYMKYQYGEWGLPANLADRLCVIHNGTYLTEFSHETLVPGKFRRQHGIGDETKIISFAARMAHEKNPFIFIEIARALMAKSSRKHKLCFVMAGGGPLWDSLKARIRDYGLDDYFILPGVMANVSELLRDSFLFVMVSTHEGIPLSMQEAMLMNVPVISTRVGAIHEIIHDGANGYLISRDEQVVEQSAEKIKFLLDNPDVYREMSSKTRESVYPEFTSETMCRCYGELFAQVLQVQAEGQEADCEVLA